MFGLNATQLIFVLVIILLIWGVAQLPKVAKTLNASSKQVQKDLKEAEADGKKVEKKETKKKTKAKQSA